MSVFYDAIIIGTGQAGPPLANRLTKAGQTVAVIERGLFGGTCVNTGCIPTKTMVASAYAAHMARRGAEYGVQIEGAVKVDMKRVKARKDEVSGKSNSGVESWLKEMENCTVYEGHARFRSSHEVRVGEATLIAGQIFINVGARAIVPDIPDIDEIDYLTNSTMMDLDVLPEHLIIVGGSYVALEFGQMFRRFGSEVTILQRGTRLIQREDEDVSDAIGDVLAKEGVRILTEANCKRFEKRSGQVVVSAEIAGQPQEIRGSHLLLAVGRRPNTDDLRLDEAGIVTDKRGHIVVDDQLQTNVAGVWALGDCNGRGAFTHTSYNDHEIVASNVLDWESRSVKDRISAYAVYIDPPLARAGMTEREVRESGRKVLVGKREMSRVGRAQEKGETQGFMKILVDENTQEILGASLLGTGCDEVIHSILDVMYAKKPYTVIQRAMHIHPTVSELVPTMLGELQSLE